MSIDETGVLKSPIITGMECMILTRSIDNCFRKPGVLALNAYIFTIFTFDTLIP